MRKDIKSKALQRLKIIEGQIRGLRQMVEEEKYCIDIITQTQAVKNALSSVESTILKNYLETCAMRHIKTHHPEKVVNEILKIYSVSQKK